MTHFGVDAWEWPPDAVLTGDRLRVRRVNHHDRRVILSGSGADDKRHILIRINDGESEPTLVVTRGVGVMVRHLAEPGHEPGRFIDIVCHETGGHAAFCLIGDEIARGLAVEGTSPSDVVNHVISRWRHFWGRVPQSSLTLPQQIGLFAELWFLHTWLGRNGDIAAAVGRWRGPTGARHDFEWEGYSIEVKATTSVNRLVHRINGVNQLVPPDTGLLHLFSLQVRQEEGAANSLPSLVERIRSLAAGTPNTAMDFEDKLARIGYASSHEAEYVTIRLRVSSEGLYRVNRDFPRIVPSSFSLGVPSGVEAIEYDVNLSGFEHLRVASRPSEMPV